MSSYPYALDWADEHLPALVWTSHGGQETGHAVAAVLFGDAEPAGRLPQSWYRGDDELPHPLDYDIIKAGWTYQYHRTAPLYPFGHGLSYTDFAYRDLRLSSEAVPQDGSLDISVTVANTGARPGSDVVQVYARALAARYDAPQLHLVDFRKVRVGAGDSEVLAFRLPVERLAHWDVARGAFTVDPGDYEIVVARSAGNHVLVGRLTVTGENPTPRAVVDRHTHAVDFDDYSDLVLVDATKATGDAVAPADPTRPAAVLFRAVNLTGAVGVEVEVARADGSGEARLEFHLADRSLGVVDVPVTGDRHTWTTATARFEGQLDGVHDLWLTLRGDFGLTAFRLTSSHPAAE
jgi:beta-glucosidase